ncbi:orotidine-5'-phosphate decarboxylase [Breznakiella homolactica]|uniref:Orotidine 5'-phosphate decarboxylase n=1 Tax=Breznakiella homolactica TaxID=2798577 RepID=A0A7T8BBM2_9SPIR|nr:orotidine-5'-phosphate decarboxylase [Breznakiella homolactica]QQO10551.1 orotidine-5'-phosphate decarboxylase [Breznakiella homolactica]
MRYNMDRLYERVADKGHVCVGLDTAPDYIPPSELRKAESPAEAVLKYNRAIIDATSDIAACFKLQIAYYEELGIAGLEVYARTLAYLRERDLLAIADIKRGDIADTASRYARAHFEGEFEADFVTLAPYMGMDSITPWLAYAERRGKGAFVLMRTSNPGMRDFEYRELAAGGRLYDAVGDKLAELARESAGKYGYGAFGAVVGCTEREEASVIRRKRENLFFLIPGYGAQGGAADDAALLLSNGNGGVVNASRSILKAWNAAGISPEDATNETAAGCAREAAAEMRDAIRTAAAHRAGPAKQAVQNQPKKAVCLSEA